MIQAFLAALALPVVGFVTGRVVGDYYSLGGLVGEIGMGVGITVYMIALMASYAHLRNFYARFEHHPARAAPFIALAVEVVTFYLSFSYVVLHSQWAFWGSLVGAFVVFWGNFQSMAGSHALRGEGLTPSRGEGLKAGKGAPPSVERKEAPPDTAPLPGHAGVYPVGNATGRRLKAEAGAFPLEVPLSGRSAASQIRAEAPSRVPPNTTPLPIGDASVLSTGNTAGEEVDSATRVILEMAERGEVGPSAVARALGIPRSTAYYRLRSLEEEGLVVRNGRGYIRRV